MVATTTSVTDGTSVIADKTKPKITSASIASDNGAMTSIVGLGVKRPNGWDAKRNVVSTNDVVTLLITASEFIYTPAVTFKTGGKAIGDASITYLDTKKSDSQVNANKVWTCKYTGNAVDTDGIVTFILNYRDAAGK